MRNLIKLPEGVIRTHAGLPKGDNKIRFVNRVENTHPLHIKPKLFQVCREIPRLRSLRKLASQKGESVGFVPTMGALHDGHFALIRQAAVENKRVYVSIYVNPTQFGVNEDLASYPRTWEDDLRKLTDLCHELKDDFAYKGQITTVFAPKTKDMYPNLPPTSEPNGHGSFVNITPLSSVLEGASRPVFFRGVATVVMKLLNIVQPDSVYFGQKDIQQVYVVRRMVEDFHLDTQIRVGRTIRESNGLALSSRNVYLGQRRRENAIALLMALQNVQDAYSSGKRTRADLLEAAHEVTDYFRDQALRELPHQRAQFEVDYFSIADSHTMEELSEVDPAEGAIVSGAIRMLPIEDPREGERLGVGEDKGIVRLIDNIRLDLVRSKLEHMAGGYYELRQQTMPFNSSPPYMKSIWKRNRQPTELPDSEGLSQPPHTRSE